MLKVFIIRHGETDWNLQGRMQGWTDTSLNARGLEQAGLIARRMQDESGFAALYSSPLQRAWQTAQVVGRAMGLSPIPDERLKERCLGIIEGLTFPEVQEHYPDLYRQWRSEKVRVALPGEEGREIFRDRVQSLVQEIQERHPDGKIVLVTHGGALGMIMATVMHLEMERHFPFWFDNACLNIVELGGRTPRVMLLNDTCHLRQVEHRAAAEQEVALDDQGTDESR